MMEKDDTKKVLAAAALIGIAGVATYAFLKTYNLIKTLDNVELDFGNDSVLSSLFKKD